MSSVLDRRTFPAGQRIITEESTDRNAYIIEKGLVEITKGGDSVDNLLGTMAKGSIFGEISLVDGGPRTATVVALTNVTAVVVPLKVYLEKTADADPFLTALIRVLVKNLRSYGDRHHTRYELHEQGLLRIGDVEHICSFLDMSIGGTGVLVDGKLTPGTIVDVSCGKMPYVSARVIKIRGEHAHLCFNSDRDDRLAIAKLLDGFKLVE